jgi:uncharacterized BrkB/YihY/UPF0761 family membrane protein
MAMFPMILGALAIIGLVVNGPGIQSQAQTAILRALPGQSGKDLTTLVTLDLHHYAGLLGIAGILGLLWGVTNFFGSLEFCLSRIFDFPQRGFLRQRAMGAVMMFVLVAGLLIAVAANTLMNLIPVMAGIGPVAGPWEPSRSPSTAWCPTGPSASASCGPGRWSPACSSS